MVVEAVVVEELARGPGDIELAVVAVVVAVSRQSLALALANAK